MTPQNPKMLTVKYKKKEYVEIDWERKTFCFSGYWESCKT